METRLPVTVTLSTALHLGGAAAWLYLHQVSKKAPLRVIADVDLLVTRRPEAPTVVAKASPPSTWNFLKMALPSVPQAIKPMEIKTPEASRKLLMEAPQKLDDRGRLKKNESLDALDLSRKRAEAALDVGQLEARTRRPSVTELPKLEEVGIRRAPKRVIEMAALAEEQRSRLMPQDLSALSAAPRAGRAAPEQALLPQEAAPASRKNLLSKAAELLPASAPLALAPVSAPAAPRRMDALKSQAPAREQASLLGEKKKSVEIEGPLSGRKVVYYEVPKFPDWASAQGILEAEVRIRFYVSASGEVLPEMRVETTSGFGRLDRLAMDSLKRWRFEPILDAGRQWGIITFRFLLE